MMLQTYRNEERVAELLARISERQSQDWSIMEVCGGQTHAFLHYGLDQLLPKGLQLIHGPGCPVCVTPVETLQRAIDLAYQKDVLLCCFGDMLRVPAASESLAQAKARGASVQLVYSPLDAIALAKERPDKQIVLLAVGFETTAPLYALAAKQARYESLPNFSLLTALVRVLPALELILADPENRIDAVLAAGHVCAVAGYRDYEALVQRFHCPIAVTGFEPVDLLNGLYQSIEALERRQPVLLNAYERVATPQGTRNA